MIAKVIKLKVIFNLILYDSFKTLKTLLDLKALRQARLIINRSPFIKKLDRIFKSIKVLII
jgi:hypothetical protein